MKALHFDLEGEALLLLGAKAVFWPRLSVLLVADLHLGKSSHFRKHGLAVPEMAERNNLWRLSGLFNDWQPKEVIFLGDLFHSKINKAWHDFVDFMEAYPNVKRTLILGNHDILGADIFAEANLHTAAQMELGPFLLSHDAVENARLFNLFGHVHPAIRLRGAGKQSLTLPCFYFDLKRRYGIMPSFGDFTGIHLLKASKQHNIFVVSGGEVIQVA